MRIGILGQANQLALRARAGGLEAVALEEALGSKAGGGKAGRQGGAVAAAGADLLAGIDQPRLCLLDLAPGAAVDEALEAVAAIMEPGDVVVDFSGSYWGDTLRRWRRLRHRALFFLDAALLDSGLHLAGDARGVDLAEPALRRLARPSPLLRAGSAGAAHFALMVDDARRTAVGQAVAEARQALEAFPGEMAPAVAAAMLECCPDGGPRAAWLLDDAVRLQAALPLLAQAVMLEIGDSLDQMRPHPCPPRLGGFTRPDEIG